MKSVIATLGSALVISMALNSTADAQGLLSRNRVGPTVVIAAPHGPLAPPPVVVVESRVVRRPAFDPYRDALQRLRSRNNNSRRDGALTLGRLGDPRAVPDLVWLMRNDRGREVREASALALGAIGDARALSALQHAALTDRNRRVRQVANHARGQILFDAPVIEATRVVVPPSVIEMEVEVEVEPDFVDAYEPAPAGRRVPASPPPAVEMIQPLEPFEYGPDVNPLPPALPPPATELELTPVPVPYPAGSEPALDPEHERDPLPPGPLAEPGPALDPPLDDLD